MMKKGVPLAAVEKEFQMKSFSGWDRTEHLPWIAATIHRELQGLGPQVITVAERRLSGVVSSAVQDGRFVTVTTGDGTQVRLRVTGDTVFEGIGDRTENQVGDEGVSGVPGARRHRAGARLRYPRINGVPLSDVAGPQVA